MKYYKLGHGKWRKSLFIAQYEQFAEKLEKQRNIAKKELKKELADAQKLHNQKD